MKLIKLSSLLMPMLLMWSSCTKDNSTDPNNGNGIILNGVSYDATSGYNSDSTAFLDFRDRAVYSVVTIGNQTWMAENLRYNASGSWLNSNNPSMKYGRLYDWSTVMNGSGSSSVSPSGVQGICPSRWHVPSDEEWKTLDKALGMSQTDADNTGWRGTDEGTKMKSTSGWSNNGNGSNASGFNAFPTGYYRSGSYDYLGDYANFWSSTELSTSAAWYRYLNGGLATVARVGIIKSIGLSCRCVEN